MATPSNQCHGNIMRVLVTGGFGFTGKYLVTHLLDKGYQTQAMVSKLDDIEQMNAELKKYDPQIVVHLAGISNARHSIANDFYEVNLIGSRNLLASIADNCPNISCVVMASTAHIYASEDGGVLSEDSLIKPANDYAVSKYSMELMARLWMKKLPIVITRPFNYTGIGQPAEFVIPKIVEHFKANKPVISMGSTHLFREFGDVRDVVEVYENIIAQPPVGEALNICSNQPVRLDDVINSCRDITGHELRVEVNPAFVREGEPETLIGDRSKLFKYFNNLKPRELHDTLSWMLSS
jgi:nucleoside-diphosphate-sugar epimerase